MWKSEIRACIAEIRCGSRRYEHASNVETLFRTACDDRETFHPVHRGSKTRNLAPNRKPGHFISLLVEIQGRQICVQPNLLGQ